jgi:hypothetical protein
MKKLKTFLLFAVIGGLVFMYSCSDDEEAKPAPQITPPAGVIDVENGGSGTATFTVAIASGLTASWTATGTNVQVTTASGDVTGTSVAVPFTAGTNAGAGQVRLTVTDSEQQSAVSIATVNILAAGDNPITFNTNGNIPATATVTEGDTLTVSGVDIASEDGIKQVTVTVNGVAAPGLGLDSVYSGSPTTAEYEFSLPTGPIGGGTYNVVFTAEDDNGSTATFSHALTVEKKPAVEKVYSDVLEEDAFWSKDTVHILAGRISVLDGVTLTIEAGAIIKGQPGTGAASTALLIARGATLIAEGTADAPIIFTSVSDEIRPIDVANGNFGSPNLAPDVPGLWGGLLILGKARISAQNENDEDVTEAQIEGIPTSDPNGLYGGLEDDDNSGSIKYISIRHGGTLIGSGNEINGLTLGGVGSETVIENVEIVANQDDGIEWFGGTVSIDGAVVWNAGDDAIDGDQAWAGGVTNFIVVNPGDRAFELDGPEGSYTSPNYQINNGTVYMAEGVELLDLDDKTDVDIKQIYYYGITAGQVVSGYAGFAAEGIGTATNFETTLPSGTTVADVFVDMPAEEIVEVAENANTVGPVNANDFQWTWAAQSGALSSIGL